MKPTRIFSWLNLLGCLLIAGPAFAASAQAQQRRPNIVLIFPDNLGWGEVGVYGGVRGVPTPRIDRLAAEGMRLNNFNVEFS
jgi:arylsulfatase